MERALKKLEEKNGLSADTKRELKMQGFEAMELYYNRIKGLAPVEDVATHAQTNQEHQETFWF